MSVTITRDDWLQALADAGVPLEDDRGAVTVNEFAEMFALTSWMAAYHLRNLHAKGRAVRTSKRGPDTAGRQKMLVAYRLVTDAKPKKRRQGA